MYSRPMPREAPTMSQVWEGGIEGEWGFVKSEKGYAGAEEV